MGCAPSFLEEDASNSTEEEKRKQGAVDYSINSSNPENVLASYIAIDKEIVQMENSSPAPMFARTAASITQIKSVLNEMENHNGRNVNDHEDILTLFMELGVHRSPNIAVEHEEFIANANRRVLEKNLLRILRKIFEGSERKLESCSKKVNYLQMLYQRQEALLMNVFGATYGSEKEKLIEQETDTMRNFRDTLAMGVVQWQECADDTKAASDLALRGIISWKSLKKHPIEKKLKLATEARNHFQEALFLVQRSQDSLPGVPFPYCSARELTAVLQAIEYIFTDILIEERYVHALEVYDNFQRRTSALYRWMTQTLASSLRKDLSEFDEKVIKVAEKLRVERINLICSKYKIPNNYSELGFDSKLQNIHPITGAEPTSTYQKPMIAESRYTRENRYGDVLTNREITLGPALGIQEDSGSLFSDPNLQRDFENKLAARRSAMWPSRRMEELRQLTLQDY